MNVIPKLAIAGAIGFIAYVIFNKQKPSALQQMTQQSAPVNNSKLSCASEQCLSDKYKFGDAQKLSSDAIKTYEALNGVPHPTESKICCFGTEILTR